MTIKLSRDQAETVALAILSQEPRFADTWLGRASRILRNRRMRDLRFDDEVAIRKVPEPSIESPGSPYWGVFHRG